MIKFPLKKFKSSPQTPEGQMQVLLEVILAFCFPPSEQKKFLQPPNSVIHKYCVLLKVYAFWFSLEIFTLTLALPLNVLLIV